MLRLRSPQGATLAPDGSARPDCKGCCVRRGGNYRTVHTEKSTQRGDGALPMPQGRGLRADREGQFIDEDAQVNRVTREPVNRVADKHAEGPGAPLPPTRV